MTPVNEFQCLQTRRHFFGRVATGVGSIAIAHLLGEDSLRAADSSSSNDALDGLPHFAPKAKRVIWLFQSGGPSQLETFDPKPGLNQLRGQDLPESVRKGQRLTTMTASQTSFPLVESAYGFKQHGASGTWVSELLPHTAKIADEISVVRTMHTDAINHDPAVTFLQTGAQIAGRASVGSWLSYGLGSESSNLPSFVVMITQGTGGQPLYDRLWESGFLPTRYQGVKFRSVVDPVLFLSDPKGFTRGQRRDFLDALGKLNQSQFEQFGDPEIVSRIAQYEMAFKMQQSVPELTDLSTEADSVFDLYGEDARRPGSYAYNCLLARRLAERGVRFIQLYHRGWDQHGSLPSGIKKQTRNTDQASAALVQDLKQRGLLEDTLVIWGGEFGRTVYCQGTMTENNYGRDHHPRCFSIWMAGGGIKPGMNYGSTDEFSYNITENPVHVHDLHATLLHLMGVDHTRLTFKFQGRRFRLTDVHGNIVKPLVA